MYDHRAVVMAVLFAVAAPLGLTQQPSTGTGTLQIQPLPSPAGPDSAQPQLTVSDRGALLSWIERSGQTATLKFSERTSSGWSEPRMVASGADWFVNWADVPSVVRLADGTLAAHWLQKSGPGTYAYDVRLSYSHDEGKTWSSSFTPHHDGTNTEHGFASLFQMPGAGLGLVWLDGRAMVATSKTGGNHEGHGDGAMSIRFAAFDRSWKQVSDMPIDLRVCECCPTTAVVTSEGVLAAFRDRSEEEIRDIYVARFEHGKWTEPAAVYKDNWRIPACPVNGPALSARGRDVAIAWFTGTNDVPQAQIAFSSDAGRTFGTPVRLDDDASLGRVDVELLPGGSAVAAYIEYANQRSQFRVRRVERSGRKSAPVTIAGIEGSRSSGHPRIAIHRDELVFAWIERDGTLHVRTAVARLPPRHGELRL
jgi:hypothetical protein